MFAIFKDKELHFNLCLFSIAWDLNYNEFMTLRLYVFHYSFILLFLISRASRSGQAFYSSFHASNDFLTMVGLSQNGVSEETARRGWNLFLELVEADWKDLYSCPCCDREEHVDASGVCYSLMKRGFSFSSRNESYFINLQLIPLYTSILRISCINGLMAFLGCV